MSMSIERCAEITANSCKILTGFLRELSLGATPKRVKEIERDSSLIKLILKYIWMPYIEEMRDYFDEDTLDYLGF